MSEHEPTEYLFEPLAPLPTLDEPLGLAARINLRQAIRRVEEYRSGFPAYTDARAVFTATILPRISTPTKNGAVGAVFLLPIPPARMRGRTRRSALARFRRWLRKVLA